MRVIKTLFWISDVAAWLLLFLALVGSLLMAYSPIFYAMDHEPISWSELLTTLVGCLLVAKGAYELTRRRVWALLLVALPAFAALLLGNIKFGLVYLGSCMLVFGLPLGLAFRESRAWLPKPSKR